MNSKPNNRLIDTLLAATPVNRIATFFQDREQLAAFFAGVTEPSLIENINAMVRKRSATCTFQQWSQLARLIVCVGRFAALSEWPLHSGHIEIASIESPWRCGKVVFKGGRIIRARYDDMRGMDAIVALLSFDAGKFVYQAHDVVDEPENSFTFAEVLRRVANKRDSGGATQ